MSTISTSDIIQLFGILISLITGIIAIVISIKTLNQNNQMIEESTRPYITIYTGTTYFQDTAYFIILKNFGQSGAYITNFSCNRSFEEYTCIGNSIPFRHINNTHIAPGQSFRYRIDSTKLLEDRDPLVFFIEYKTQEKSYSESIVINIEADLDVVLSRANSKDKELRTISFALQDIAEKML